MELEGIGLALWTVGGFAFACCMAMLCRGIGKSTEINPEFLANMGFWWSIIPAGTMAATTFYPPLNISHYAYFGFLFGLVPVFGALALRKDTTHADAMFGRDDQGRMSFLGCRNDEVLTTVLYSLLVFELATIFCWDYLYRA